MSELYEEFLDHDVISRLSRLTVLPRGLVEGSFTGMHRSPHRGSSVEFAEYRKYVQGDDIRNIDWRIFAKTDRYYIKEFEADTNMRLFLVIDCSASMNFESEYGTKFNYARKMAATLAHLTINQGDQVGMQCFNTDIVEDLPPMTSPAHLKAIMETMKGMTPKGETDLIDVLHKLAEKYSRRSLVLIFSDFFCDLEPLMECFQHMRFRKHDVAAFHLLDPLELSFNFDRPIRFVDLEGNSTVITEPSNTKNNYMTALHDYLKLIKKGCQEQGTDYNMVDISKSFESILSSFMLERMRK